MIFDELKIRNFFSFGKEQSISLNAPGLTLISGDNQDANGADNNAAGKSSIIEALVWCLYGETIRGYKSDEVVNNRINKNCEVKLTILDDTNTYEITRRRKYDAKKPNDLILLINGKDKSLGTIVDTQELVIEILGMDYNTFMQSVLLIHNGKSFASMSDKEQKVVLEDILQLNKLSKARDVIRHRQHSVQNELLAVNNKLSSYRQRITELNNNINLYTIKSSEFANVNRAKKLELLKRKAELIVRLEELSSVSFVKDVLDTLIDKDKENNNLISLIINVNNRLEALSEASHAERNKIARKQGELLALKNSFVDALDISADLAGKVCGVCNQFVTTDHVELVINDSQKKLDWVLSKLSDLDKEANKVNRIEEVEKESLLNERNVIQSDVEKVSKRRKKLREALVSRQEEIKEAFNIETQVAYIEESVNDLIGNSDPYVELLDKARKDLLCIEEEMRDLSAKEAELNYKLLHLNFWDKGFSNSGLKSLIMENALPFLNDRVNKYIDILADNINIEFSTQTTLKSGDVKESFQVKVTNSQGADEYTGNSSGEKRRVDLAVGWAIGDLASSRAKKSISFKGLDEPFENLDETGEETVIKFLKTVLRPEDTIFCITHSAHLKSHFNEEVTITKKNGISYIS